MCVSGIKNKIKNLNFGFISADKVQIGDNIINEHSLSNWNQFKSKQKLDFDFKSNEILNGIINEIIENIKSKNHIRITGDSGIGKTRLVYEILNRLYTSSEDFTFDDFYYYDAQNSNIERNTQKYIDDNTSEKNIVLIDNFHINHHIDLIKNNSKCIYITLDFTNEVRNIGSNFYYNYNLKSENYLSVVEEILRSFYKGKLSGIQIMHLVNFTEGNTQLAIDFANASIIDRDLNTIIHKQLKERLIFGRDEVNSNELKVLQLISCFDKLEYPISNTSTTSKDEINQRLKYLSDFIKIDFTEFKSIIKTYKDKGRIDQFGNLIVMRPLPLTLRLAIDFWENREPEDYKDFIENLPIQYREAMTNQLSKLEGYQFAKDFIIAFWGVNGNFSTAEYLNTNEGSRLFRSICTVNPSESIKVLNKHFLNKSKDEFNLSESARQNIVWALERLCFRKETFIDACKILMCIAVNEGETYYSNNAKSYFLQLFRIYLAGTEIDLIPRIEVLKWALNRHEEDYTKLALMAIRRAYSEVGGRFSGAERQGINMPLEDYTPKLYDEIWDYYKELFIILEPFISTDNSFQLLAQETIYANVNNLYNQRLPIEEIIKYLTIVSNHLIEKVSFYKELHLSIKRNRVSEEFKNEIQNFLDNNLMIEDFKDLLNLYVINTIDDYDESSIEAHRIAKKAVNDKIEISEYFDILLNGHQIYTFNFGAKYTKLSGYNEKLINDLIVYINSVSVELNISLLHGLISTLNINEKKRVFEIMKSTKSLTPFYCANFLNIDEIDFEFLFELSITKQNTLLLINLKNCLFNFNPEYVIFTLDKIKNIEHGQYIIFDLIYSLTAHDDSNNYNYIKVFLKDLIHDFNFLSLNEYNRYGLLFYQWKTMFDKMINDFPELIPIVSNQIVEYLKSNIHDSNNNYIRDVVMKLLIGNFNSSWGVFSELLIKDDFYTFYRLFGLNFASRAESNHPLFTNEEVIEKIILWLNGKQKAANWFVSIAPLFEYENNEWNKHTLRLINNFGDDEHFLNELSSNLHSMFSVGSRIPYYNARKELVSKLNKHSITRVREWSIVEVERYEQRIAEETIYEQENILKFNTEI